MKLSGLTPDQLLSAVITDETETIGTYVFHMMKTRLTQKEIKAAKENPPSSDKGK